MGMRLEGTKIENTVNTNIKSEGLLKGVIQVPGDGNPIIMMSDHGTIGGYPKIAVVVSADYDRLVQISPGSKIKFKEIDLSDAETLFKLYEMETQNLISQIESSDVQKVIFISSTSVYGRLNKVMTEEDVVLETPLTEIEDLFRQNNFFETTIIRFAGLF